MKRKLIIAGVMLFLAGLLAFVIMYSANYSKGHRAGTIAKLSRKGTIFKTYEGQLNLGGKAGTGEGDVNTGLWDFSVEKGDTSIIRQLEQAQLNGYRVRLHYVEKYFQFAWRGDTKYFVDDVETVGSPKP